MRISDWSSDVFPICDILAFFVSAAPLAGFQGRDLVSRDLGGVGGALPFRAAATHLHDAGQCARRARHPHGLDAATGDGPVYRERGTRGRGSEILFASRLAFRGTRARPQARASYTRIG